MGISKKKTRICVMALVVISLFLSLIPIDVSFADSSSDSNNDRIFGETKFETAFEIAGRLYDEKGPFRAIVVAYGDNYPDALSGSYLAYMKDAPIVLVNEKREDQVYEYIRAHLRFNGKVYILGGEQAVREEFQDRLEKAGVKCVRLGGATMFETNLEILKEAGSTEKEILLCTAYGYQDSISASATGKPIMLVGKKLRADQIEYLKKLNPTHIYVIGGQAAVGSDVVLAASRIAPTERVWGSNAIETGVQIARRFFSGSVKKATFTTVHNFPDGLAGGPFALEMGSPILVVSKKSINGSVANYVGEKNIKSFYTLGGTGAVTDATINAVTEVYVNRPPDMTVVGKGTAQDMINVMRSWIGYNEVNRKHLEILNIYNKIIPPGYHVMQSYDEWCDACISAAAYKAGCVDLIGVECGVGRHVDIFRRKGIWIEDETIVPKPGYLIVFSYSNNTHPNNTGASHIGLVEYVNITGYDTNGNPIGTIGTIEGNASESVMRLQWPLAWVKIRGYAAPNYAS